MAKQNQTPVAEQTFNCPITVPVKYNQMIAESITGDGALVAKIALAAEGALLDLCEGGLMLNAVAVRKLAEANGGIAPGVDQVVEQFQKGVGRVNGAMQITVSLPPEYEQVVRQAAEFQGMTTAEILNNSWNFIWDNGDLYDPRPFVERVIMRNADKQALVKMLGKDFQTGTELAGLVQKYLKERSEVFAEMDDK
jgi:hypothetical protein